MAQDRRQQSRLVEWPKSYEYVHPESVGIALVFLAVCYNALGLIG